MPGVSQVGNPTTARTTTAIHGALLGFPIRGVLGDIYGCGRQDDLHRWRLLLISTASIPLTYSGGSPVAFSYPHSRLR
jgi:hypothetical protein